jgi:hypothetical protein
MVTMANTLEVRALAMMASSHCLAGQGQTLAPAGPHRQLGGDSLPAVDCLGLLLVMELIIAS